MILKEIDSYRDGGSIGMVMNTGDYFIYMGLDKDKSHLRGILFKGNINKDAIAVSPTEAYDVLDAVINYKLDFSEPDRTPYTAYKILEVINILWGGFNDK